MASEMTETGERVERDGPILTAARVRRIRAGATAYESIVTAVDVRLLLAERDLLLLQIDALEGS